MEVEGGGGGGEQRNRLKCCAPHPNSGIQAAIQSSLKGVIYYVSFKRLSELLSQDPPQRAINEPKMNMYKSKRVMPLFKGRILFVCLNRSGLRL